jgi:hypothetical protein
MRYRTTDNLVYHSNQVTQVSFTEVADLSDSELIANFIYKIGLYSHISGVSASHLGDPGLNPVICTMGKVPQVYPPYPSNTFCAHYTSVEGNFNY